MRLRSWLSGLLVAGIVVAAQPLPARAAIWPFSLFTSKKPTAKKTKGKPKKSAAYGARAKQAKTINP
jgi:hypothetical protein